MTCIWPDCDGGASEALVWYGYLDQGQYASSIQGVFCLEHAARMADCGAAGCDSLYGLFATTISYV